ncbi:MAG: alpha/beta hydrolase [Marinirhabdus sp.]|nr:alpha/beta hydrolase [Marinirhabdus sp.]
MIFTYDTTAVKYTIEGTGPTLLFIHGFLESSTMWQSIIPHFKTSHQVITLDLPGHGESECMGQTHSMEDFAAVMIGLLDHLQIETATFIGHSMGGYATLAVAEKHPERIRNLVLLNSSPVADSPERQLNRERALQLIPNAKDAFISMAITNLFSSENQEKLEHEIHLAKEEAKGYPLEGILAAIRGMKVRKDRSSSLKSFKNPKFMICGAEDPILPLTECKTVANTTDTELFIVPNGHMSHLEAPSEVVKKLHFIENICT